MIDGIAGTIDIIESMPCLCFEFRTGSDQTPRHVRRSTTEQQRSSLTATTYPNTVDTSAERARIVTDVDVRRTIEYACEQCNTTRRQGTDQSSPSPMFHIQGEAPLAQFFLNHPFIFIH